MTGTFLNETEKTCKKCDRGCLECDKRGCNVFEQGMTLFEGNTIKCGHGCDDCNVENPR